MAERRRASPMYGGVFCPAVFPRQSRKPASASSLENFTAAVHAGWRSEMKMRDFIILIILLLTASESPSCYFNVAGPNTHALSCLVWCLQRLLPPNTYTYHSKNHKNQFGDQGYVHHFIKLAPSLSSKPSKSIKFKKNCIFMQMFCLYYRDTSLQLL